MKSKIASLQPLRKSFKPIQNVYSEHKKQLSKMDRLVIGITTRIGSMGFFLIIFGWSIAWLGWNTLAPLV